MTDLSNPNQAVVTIACYRGHTHAEFALLQSSSVGSYVGAFIRKELTESEYIPEGMQKDVITGRWVKRFAHWETKHTYAKYDYKAQKLHVPIAYCDDIINDIKLWGAEVKELEIPSYPLRRIDVEMNPSFHDQEHQVKLIEKCSETVPGMKGLAMQTGKGKTYSAIKSSVNLGYATVVIVAGLVDQWIEKGYKECTLIKDEDIYKIEGFESLARLAKNPNYRPKVFIASLRTMQIFRKGANDYDLLPWTFKEFFKEYGIGTKIVDECHLNFHAITMMDLETNVPYNLYCSATFSQTGKDARRIFMKIFPESIQYGIDAYDKYVSVYFFQYSGDVLEKKCIRAQKYMHARYEAQLMISNHKFTGHVESTICPLINQFFVPKYEKGRKGLIFCTSIEFVHRLCEKLSELYPEYKVVSYTGGDKMESLQDADLIVSTTGKAGTGLDIKGLILAINTVSLRTPVLTRQLLGRLRKINGCELVYVDRCDTNIGAQRRHAEDRILELKHMAKKFYMFNGFHDTSVQTGEIPLFS